VYSVDCHTGYPPGPLLGMFQGSPSPSPGKTKVTLLIVFNSNQN